MSFTTEQALSLLSRARSSGRLAHAYLVTGSPSTGKRELAARFAGVLVGRDTSGWPPPAHPDVHIIEPESKSRRILIEQIRTVEHGLRLRPTSAEVKVAILVDADRLQPQAANAFLKTLEEPPDNTHLILLSAHPEMMLTTILSRCLRVHLNSAKQQVAATPAEETLLADAARCFSSRKRTVGALLMLSRQIQNHLAARKEAIRKQLDQALKDEKNAWGDNADREWLAQREAHFDALADARYRSERENLILRLLDWWADVLRDCATQDNARVNDLSIDEITAAIDRLDAIRDSLGRNAQEALALDAGLLGLVTRG